MSITKKMIVPVLAAAVVGVSAIGLGTVAAQSSGDTLVEKIASRFNLSQEEVQAVFDETRQEKQAEHQAKLGEKLQAKVDDGTITAEQKTLLEEKLAQQREEHQANRDSELTKEERHEQRQQNREAFEAWAEENNIPLDELDLHGPHGHGHGKHRGGDDQVED